MNLRPSPRPAAESAVTLEDVQRAIERLAREDRAMLRPWLLAHFDVRGYRRP